MIFLDTEQTGMKENRVCQIAYLTLRNGSLLGRNEFFQVDEMNRHAFEAHGFSVKGLERLSNYKTFKDKAESILEELAGHTIVGHNISSDIRVIRSEFSRCGMVFKPSGQLCTMTHFAPVMNIPQKGQFRPKPPSLSELCDYLGVRQSAIFSLSEQLYGDKGRPHDARYDACATYLCADAADRKGLIRGLLPERR